MPKKAARTVNDDPAAEGIAKLRKYHRLGRTLLQESPEQAVYGQRAMRKRAEELGTKGGHAVHLRLFARRYSDRDLAELLAQQASASRPLGWSHLRQLEDVAAPELRCHRANQNRHEGKRTDCSRNIFNVRNRLDRP